MAVAALVVVEAVAVAAAAVAVCVALDLVVGSVALAVGFCKLSTVFLLLNLVIFLFRVLLLKLICKTTRRPFMALLELHRSVPGQGGWRRGGGGGGGRGNPQCGGALINKAKHGWISSGKTRD